LAGEDRTKWDYVFNLKVIEFLNTLAYRKDRNDYRVAQIEKQNRKWR
jgi:hypothetical protein